jgi:thioredoxin reductase
MNGSQLTLSLNNWLELPGLEFQDWLREHRHETVRKPCTLVKNSVASLGNSYERATTSHVAEYYKDYVETKSLSSYFSNDSKVLSAKRGSDGMWEIHGVKGICPFVVRAHNAILATGNNVPKVLGVPGERHQFVYHQMADLEKPFRDLETLESQPDPCLVGGAGLSAGDAILELLLKGIPVIHSIRRGVNDRNIIFNNLTSTVYPEYSSIQEMMKGTHEKAMDGSYECFPKTKLVEIRKNKECVLRKADGTLFKKKVSCVFVLIGASPELSFLHGVHPLGMEKKLPIDSKKNPIDINPFTYECQSEPGLYALGPLVGDNFVRFGMGGGLGVVNHLFRGDELN